MIFFGFTINVIHNLIYGVIAICIAGGNLTCTIYLFWRKNNYSFIIAFPDTFDIEEGCTYQSILNY